MNAVFMASLKALAGFRSNGTNRRATLSYATYPDQVASASTVTLTETGLVFQITGTTTINSLLVERSVIVPGRRIVLEGVSGTAALVTHTDIASQAEGTIHLLGDSNITLSENEYLELEQRSDGSWFERLYVALGS